MKGERKGRLNNVILESVVNDLSALDLCSFSNFESFVAFTIQIYCFVS